MRNADDAKGAVGVAASAVDGLKSSPALLMLIMLVALVLGLTAWSVQKNQDRQQALIERLVDGCLMKKD